jgi:photosystem II stability/assembly factor-like uncharacterized protein
MKNFYILLIALFMVNGANAQWVQQNSITTSDLYSVYFTNVNVGYAAGMTGDTILKTTDGGTIWVPQTAHWGYSVHFPNTDTGYIASTYCGTSYACWCKMFKTIDGGENWEDLPVDITGSLLSVHFPKTHTGYAVGFRRKDNFPTPDYQSFIVKTINGGGSWIECHTFPWNSGYQNSVYFINVDTGYIAGDVILKTTDGGITWVTQNSGYDLNSIYFTDANTGFAVGYNGTILKTTDGGTNWVAQNSNSTRKLSSVHFPSADSGYVVGGDDYDVSIILKTTNGGANWVTQDSGTYANLLSVHFPTVDTGYAVGVGGTILKTVNGGGFPVGNNDLSSKSSTLNIYPNPSSDNITIETSVNPQSGTLSIMNLHGQQIITRQITELTTQINLSKLPSGVYFVRLKGDMMMQVGKIIKE